MSCGQSSIRILLFLLCAAAVDISHAWAQQEIEVNTTVLHNLSLHRPAGSFKPVHLRPPADANAGTDDMPANKPVRPPVAPSPGNAPSAATGPSLTAPADLPPVPAAVVPAPAKISPSAAVTPAAPVSPAPAISTPAISTPAMSAPVMPAPVMPALVTSAPAMPVPVLPPPLKPTVRPRPPVREESPPLPPVPLRAPVPPAGEALLSPPGTPSPAEDRDEGGGDDSGNSDGRHNAGSSRPALFLPDQHIVPQPEAPKPADPANVSKSDAPQTDAPQANIAPPPPSTIARPAMVPQQKPAAPAINVSAAAQAGPVPLAALAPAPALSGSGRPEGAGPPGDRPEDDQAVQFPVVTTTRSESTDPSLPSSSEVAAIPPAPLASPSDVPVNGTVISELGRQLASPSAEKPVSAPPVLDKPPVPTPKPQMEKIMAARSPTRIEATSRKPDRTAALPGHGPDAFPLPRMPAVPPKKVDVVTTFRPEKTPVLVPDEALLGNMMQMHKNQVMAGVEDVVKRTQAGNGKPAVPFERGGRHVSRGSTTIAARMLKTNNAIITADTPPTRAPQTPVAPKPANDDSVLASLGTPNMPPEADYKAINSVSITYDPAQIALNDIVQDQLKTRILPLMQKDARARLQIQAFASEGKESHTSRQRSLARALAVRQYLLSQGIEAARLDIRALGMQSDRDPLDRVDFVVLPNDKDKAPL